MSYHREVARLAERQAALVMAPDRSTSTQELELVDAARLTVRQLCRQVLGDSVGPDSVWEPLLADLVTRPVAAFRGLLEFDLPHYGPKPTNSGWKDFNVVTPAGRLWRDTRLHAALAAHEWSLIPTAERPQGDEMWSVVADIAAIAEASAQLERDLEQAHPDAAAGLRAYDRDREGWQLAIVADHVRQVASAGPLPHVRLPQPRRTVAPVRVKALMHAPAAMARLALMLRTVDHLKPQTVRALIQSQARTMTTVAAVIADSRTAGSAHAIVDGLRSVAASLSATLRYFRPYASITEDDPRPLTQVRELRTAWRHFEERPDLPLSDAVRRAAAGTVRPALDVVTAVSDLTSRLVRHGDWCRQGVPGSGRPRGPTPDGEPHARIIKAVEDAAKAADRLSTHCQRNKRPAPRSDRHARS